MLIRSTIRRVGYSTYCLEIKEDRLTGPAVLVFEGYYGSAVDAEEARNNYQLGFSVEESTVPMCHESEKYSILIKRDGFWTFGPYWDQEVFAMNTRLEEPDVFNGKALYTVTYFRKVYLRNVVLYPITIYAEDPEELVCEHMPMLTKLIDRLRPNRRRYE